MSGRSSFAAGILLVAGVACASAQNNSLPLLQIKLPPRGGFRAPSRGGVRPTC